MIRQILNPDLYHGNHEKGNYFEGWYFKIVNKSGDVFAFIPGIKHSLLPDENYSFIQVYHGNTFKLNFIKYDFNAFRASRNRFEIHIDNNLFSNDELLLKINSSEISLNGKLSIKNIVSWPHSILNPGSMGFYNYLTFMECYSQVCAMSGEVEGSFTYNGKDFDFKDSKIYIEKNWGKAFPYSYIWTQCCNFVNRDDISLSCSIGNIPMVITDFTGFLIGLHTADKFYRFTTMNRSKLNICIEKDKLHIHTFNKHHSLLINSMYDRNKFVMLYAPNGNTMQPSAKETLVGNVEIILKDNKTEETLLKANGNSAGIEFAGDIFSLAIKR